MSERKDFSFGGFSDGTIRAVAGIAFPKKPAPGLVARVLKSCGGSTNGSRV